jgi:hypothetical protein
MPYVKNWVHAKKCFGLEQQVANQQKALKRNIHKGH